MIVMKISVAFMKDTHESHLMPCDNSLKKKRGRPKCFDEQQALQKAMLLFWEHGFEATSMSDLTQALGLTAPSLYSSFGDRREMKTPSFSFAPPITIYSSPRNKAFKVCSANASGSSPFSMALS